MHTISASEANRNFSRLLRQATQGRSVTILSRGRPVATIGPAHAGQPERAAARRRLLQRLRQRAPTPLAPWSRNELY